MLNRNHALTIRNPDDPCSGEYPAFFLLPRRPEPDRVRVKSPSDVRASPTVSRLTEQSMFGADMVSQTQLRPVINIQESQPLSPMQPDMLSHEISAAHSGVNIEQVQVISTLPREINVAAFHRTWERVVEQHAILRTGLLRDGLQPGREVRPRVRFHFEHKDWRGLAEHGQKSRLAAYLQAERRRGFNLSAPPLMRLTLFRVGQAKHILAWTFHQWLLDSCAAIALLNNVFRFYEAFCRKPDCEPPPPRPYRHYIAVMGWSSSQFDNKRIKLNSRTARSAKENPMAENEENT